MSNIDNDFKQKMEEYDKQQERKIKITLLIIGIFILVFVIIGFISMFSDYNNNSSNNNDTYVKCYSYSKTLVKEKLKSPKSAEFPLYSDSVNA